jgi:hypothetical protein
MKILNRKWHDLMGEYEWRIEIKHKCGHSAEWSITGSRSEMRKDLKKLLSGNCQKCLLEEKGEKK